MSYFRLFLVFLKPIKIDPEMKLSRVACFVKLAQEGCKTRGSSLESMLQRQDLLHIVCVHVVIGPGNLTRPAIVP